MAKRRVYQYEPVLWDLIDPKTTLLRGDKVVKIQPYGCPRNGTMGHCFVGDPETEQFIGLVHQNSLVRVSKN
jgi:hypothetical protein